MKTYEIDGERFSTLNEFYDEIESVMQLAQWGRNLDAFNDILRGGFGTPEEGFSIRWKNHTVSKERFGYVATARQLELQLAHCHPTRRASILEELEAAKAQRGETMFDWLVDIIRVHCPGGREEQDGVDLVLD
jgi:RNAse (barnase) inhibitor barstar